MLAILWRRSRGAGADERRVGIGAVCGHGVCALASLVWKFFGDVYPNFRYNIITAEEGMRLCDHNQIPSDPCDSMYVVVDGSISVVTSDSSSRNKVENKLSRGSLIGKSRAEQTSLCWRATSVHERGMVYCRRVGQESGMEL